MERYGYGYGYVQRLGRDWYMDVDIDIYRGWIYIYRYGYGYGQQLYIGQHMYIDMYIDIDIDSG